MNFDGFLGNDALKARLAQSFAAEKVSHCYALCGPVGSGKHTLATILAAAMQCTANGQKPCRVCSACRKVFSSQHPDFILVDDAEHKNVSVDVIRQARRDVFTRPNEGKRKIYLIPRAQDLGPSSQNALLKILEEPPEYAVFLLLTTNAEQLLPTIRSRAVQLSLGAVDQAEGLAFLQNRCPGKTAEQCRAALIASGGWLGQAEINLQGEAWLAQTVLFCESYCAQNHIGMLKTLVPMEKLKRDALGPILQQWRLVLSQALGIKSGLPAPDALAAKIAAKRTAAQLLCAAQSIEQAMQALDANASVGAVVGWLCTKLK